MNNLLKKIMLSPLRPQIIIVDGYYRETSSEAIFQIFRQSHRKIKKIKPKILDFWKNLFYSGILVVPTQDKLIGSIVKILPSRKIKIIIFNSTKELPNDYEDTNQESANTVKSLIQKLSNKIPLLVNIDDEDIKRVAYSGCLTFGFDKEARIYASDMMIGGEGTNFKLNFEGKVIPVWLNKIFGREQIYAILSGIGAAFLMGINPLEASQGVRFYKSMPGKMQLIEGIKRTWILDDSENASISSMVEALDILNKLTVRQHESGGERKVVILGDILNLEEYVPEIHEKIGDKVSEIADLLFTVGSRAKFIAEGALKGGFQREKIFNYLDVDAAKLDIQSKIQEKDLILIDGAKELEMKKIVEEIKKI